MDTETKATPVAVAVDAALETAQARSGRAITGAVLFLGDGGTHVYGEIGTDQLEEFRAGVDRAWRDADDRRAVFADPVVKAGIAAFVAIVAWAVAVLLI